MRQEPYLFDEFFSSGMEESVSPFLKKSSQKWGENIPLKNAILAAILLVIAFTLSFVKIEVAYLLLAFVYFHAGIPAIIKSAQDLKSLEINIDVLMTLAAFISIVIGSGFEGALLLVLFELSGAMEKVVTHKARGAIHNLHQLAPKMALFIDEDGEITQKSVTEIEVGSKIYVKAGEIVPIDGEVMEGATSVNLVHLTGESMPVFKDVGMDVPAGATNLEAAITLKVTKTATDSTLSHIIQLITKAAEAKPKLQRVLDKFGKRYATSVIALTAFFIFTLPYLLSIPYLGVEGSIYRALTFMIAASPCALIIATPTAYLSSISSCARNGVLLKGGIILDALARCKIISFDKTGTLTSGELSTSHFEPMSSKIDPDVALSIAYGLERQVVHPVSSAIVKFATEKGIKPAVITNFISVPGHGLQGKTSLGGKEVDVYIGLSEFIQKKTDQKIDQIKREGELLSLLLIDGECFIFRFSDAPREQVKEMLESLKDLGMKTLMLTGDHKANAEKVAKSVGIEEVYADLRPDDKLGLVEKLSKEVGLAMVGDGINDAPALARSTVGISMGQIGSSTAINASDVVLLKDEIHLLGWLFSKSQKTMKIVKQNLTLALSVIVLATTPALLGIVPLWLAVILHEGGTLLVGFNSLRLLKK